MKKIIFALSLLLLCSCSYLDVVPEGKATEEDIWKTEEQAENYRYYMQTYMPNLIGYDWSPDQFAGDDFITGARGTTYYFSSKSLLYGEENANLTYFGRWAPNCTSGGTNYDIYRGIRYCFYLLDNITKFPQSRRKTPTATRARRGSSWDITTSACSNTTDRSYWSRSSSPSTRPNRRSSLRGRLTTSA